jgi:hypothetical protein
MSGGEAAASRGAPSLMTPPRLAALEAPLPPAGVQHRRGDHEPSEQVQAAEERHGHAERPVGPGGVGDLPRQPTRQTTQRPGPGASRRSQFARRLPPAARWLRRGGLRPQAGVGRRRAARCPGSGSEAGLPRPAPMRRLPVRAPAAARSPAQSGGPGARSSSGPGRARSPHPSDSETNRLSPSRRARNLAASCPLTLLPKRSSGGAKVPNPPLPGETTTIPPPMPLLPGTPTS